MRWRARFVELGRRGQSQRSDRVEPRGVCLDRRGVDHLLRARPSDNRHRRAGGKRDASRREQLGCPLRCRLRHRVPDRRPCRPPRRRRRSAPLRKRSSSSTRRRRRSTPAAGDLRRNRPCAGSTFRRRRCGEGEKPLAARCCRRRPSRARRRHRLQRREGAEHAGGRLKAAADALSDIARADSLIPPTKAPAR